ncbi:MAG: hypothetical protein HDQ99_11430 [Lachnospiraceae bacterium]|nr:hypothetical protein [Lachnospiraceae bacterium]
MAECGLKVKFNGLTLREQILACIKKKATISKKEMQKILDVTMHAVKNSR